MTETLRSVPLGPADGSTRTLPERYISVGACLAYMDVIDQKIEGKIVRVRLIRHTCGTRIAAGLDVPLKHIRGIMKQLHAAHQTPAPAPAERPEGPPAA